MAIDDQDTRVGRIVAIRGVKVTAVLDDGASGAAPKPTVGVGTLVAMPTADAIVYGEVGDLWLSEPTAEQRSAPRLAEIDILGEAAANGAQRQFKCGAATVPPLGGAVHTGTAQDLTTVYARPGESNVAIGTLHQDARLPAYVVTDRLLGKHFAVAGASGSGKSCAVALILQAILADHPNGHVVILDPHREYPEAFGDMAEVIDLSSLELPYWLMNLEEMTAAFTSIDSVQRATESAILRDLVLEARRAYADRLDRDARITVDSPIPFSLAELDRLMQIAMGRLENPEGLAPYRRLQGRIQSLARDRRFSFMFPRAAASKSRSAMPRVTMAALVLSP